jgi:hypothetical protein
MLIQIDDIIEILNDDVLFIVKKDYDLNDWIQVDLIKRNGQKISGRMTKHSLDIHSQFVINKDNLNLWIDHLKQL